ncbi:unnamed protein product [Closterium sp. Yama58-4]|nr:unnamed protein product [Closterium sp. Yama58-4]
MTSSLCPRHTWSCSSFSTSRAIQAVDRGGGRGTVAEPCNRQTSGRPMVIRSVTARYILATNPSRRSQPISRLLGSTCPPSLASVHAMRATHYSRCSVPRETARALNLTCRPAASLAALGRVSLTSGVGLAVGIGALIAYLAIKNGRRLIDGRRSASSGSTAGIRGSRVAARSVAAGDSAAVASGNGAGKSGGNRGVGTPKRSPEGLKLVGGNGEVHQELTWQLPSLQEPYRPFFGPLANCHVETIFAAVARSLPAVRFRRECLRMADGGTVALDWPVGGEALEGTSANGEVPPCTPWLILLPGLTGGSGDTYVRHMLVRARLAGWGAVVFNSRGCANSPVTSPQFYSASFTEDLRQVVRHVAALQPLSRLYAAGWSLGANILVRYIAQEGEEVPLSGAVSLCNPFDLVLADRNFHIGFNNFYDQRLGSTLRGIYANHAPLFEGLGGEYDIGLVARAKTVRDFDVGLTRVSFGYPSVDAYYRDASSCRSIKDVRLPLLCVQALDDPIAPAQGIPYDAIENNPLTMLVGTSHGGHLGWVAGPEAPFGAPWPDVLTMEFLEGLEKRAVEDEGEGIPQETAYEKLFGQKEELEVVGEGSAGGEGEPGRGAGGEGGIKKRLLPITPSRSPFPLPASPFPFPASPVPFPASPDPVPASPFPVPASPFSLPAPRFPFPFPVSSSHHPVSPSRLPVSPSRLHVTPSPSLFSLSRSSFPLPASPVFLPAPHYPFPSSRSAFPLLISPSHLPVPPSHSPFPLPIFPFRLPAPHFPFPSSRSAFPLPISPSHLPVPPSRSPFPLPIFPFRLPAPHFPFPSSRSAFPLPITPPRFPVSPSRLLAFSIPVPASSFPLPFSRSFPPAPSHSPPCSLSFPPLLPLIPPPSPSHSPPCSLSFPPLPPLVYPPFPLSSPPHSPAQFRRPADVQRH